ncbi:MAG: DUF2071 domain-containing protein [Planctomycetes bacterium]|nr:DUF2071 domain-containing protein [Planctomycetota bacterium]
MTHPLLALAGHRPWPVPSGAWVMEQTWHDLLFAHWRVDAARMRALVPSELELDTFDGAAWVGVVPFRMSGIRARGLPALPGLSAFAELNLRTYVRHRGDGGVWFFALEAEHALAVRTARALFHLPYHDARMHCRAVGDDVEYASERTHAGTPPARVELRYGPRGAVYASSPGTLEHWLTERYCLYARTDVGALLRADIHHAPWPLQPGWAEWSANTLPAAHGIAVHGAPELLHFARRLDVLIWPPRRV